MTVMETERLKLRIWADADREPFARINADLRVNEFLHGPLTRAESDALCDRIDRHFEEHGFGPFALELRETGDFIGFAGPFLASFEAHFTPCVELGWRLSPDHWGRGFATEAARAALDWCFGQLHLKEVVAFTVPANLRSRRVMEKIGMTHDPADDFDHPRLPAGDRLRRHVLYRARAASARSISSAIR